MSNDLLVSVIIPVYNGEMYLEETLLSVFSQTYKNLEIIVVDDGSVTDGSAKICAQYRDKLIYIRQENKGLSGARNTGINASRGDYIAFIDQDDLWLPEKIEKQISYYKELIKEGKNVGLVYTGLQIIDDNGHDICKTLYMSSGNNYIKLTYLQFIGTPSCVILEKKILADIGLFDEQIITSSDWDLWIRIARKYGVYSLNEFLTKYRISHNSLSKNIALMVNDNNIILKKILINASQEKSTNNEPSFKLLSHYKKQSAYSLKNEAYSYLFKEKNGKAFREYIRNGYKYDRSFFGFKVWVYYILSFFSPWLCTKIKNMKKREELKAKDLVKNVEDLNIYDTDFYKNYNT